MTLQQAINIIKNGNSNLSDKSKNNLCSAKRRWKQFDAKSMVTNFGGFKWVVEAISDNALRISFTSHDGHAGFIHASL